MSHMTYCRETRDKKNPVRVRVMRGNRVSILGNGTSIKEVEEGKIHTVPVLFVCKCRSAKERLEDFMTKARIFVPVQWSRESLEFVNEINEEVENGHCERHTLQGSGQQLL
jgi:hypothetical protein